jgi:hypothetical protein
MGERQPNNIDLVGSKERKKSRYLYLYIERIHPDKHVQ